MQKIALTDLAVKRFPIPEKTTYYWDKNTPGLDLSYGKEQCRITARLVDDKHLTLVCEASTRSGKPVEGHVVFLPHVNTELKTAVGKTTKLSQETIAWAA